MTYYRRSANGELVQTPGRDWDIAMPSEDPRPTYAVKTKNGYLACQGDQRWFEKRPTGWAVYGSEEHARGYAERYVAPDYADYTIEIIRR